MYKSLDAADLRAYTGRPWDLVGREKREFLASRFRKGGPAAARAAARRLLRRWRILHPDIICSAGRADDLVTHVTLKHQFEQASHGFRGR
jgi:hypothetical protein